MSDLPSALIDQRVAERYRVLEYLSAGSFGWVYRAEREFLGESVGRVALKLLKKRDLDRTEIRSVYRDAFMVVRLEQHYAGHPDLQHIVRVLDVGLVEMWGNRGFIILEYVDGTLTTEIGSSGIGYHIGLDFACQMARGLALAHGLETPVLHRDLKPDNVLVSGGSVAKLSDFGEAIEISRLVGRAPPAGTLAYQAPEALEGEFTTRSDVYAFGVTLYQMFTGQHPFEDVDHEVAELAEAEQVRWHRRRRREPVPPLHEVKPVLGRHPGLAAVVAKCMAYDPAQRFADAVELSATLAELKDGEGTGSGPGVRVPSPDFLLSQVRTARANGDTGGASDFLAELFALADPAAHRRELGDAHYIRGELRAEAEDLERAMRDFFTSEKAYGRAGAIDRWKQIYKAKDR